MARTKIPRTCGHCQKPFTVYIGRVNAGYGLFCSRSCQNYARHPPAAERFWSKVLKTETCWLWTAGKKNAKGYGHTCYQGKNISAHRLAYILAHGDIPEGMHVCHHCDTPPCVRPDHLFLGTNDDNMADRKAKGRYQRGEEASRTRLTTEQVREIRSLRGQLTNVQLAARYGVGRSTVAAIQCGVSWKHIL